MPLSLESAQVKSVPAVRVSLETSVEEQLAEADDLRKKPQVQDGEAVAVAQHGDVLAGKDKKIKELEGEKEKVGMKVPSPNFRLR